MPIYFIRHGESTANEQNRFAGHLESSLTALGERQARHAGRRTQALGVAFDEIHVSTLSRTHRTAALVREQIGDTATVIESPLIVERHFGVFGGRNKSLVKKSVGFGRYTEYFHSNAGAPPGGETWQDLYDRAKAYYDEVLLPAERSGRNVLVVTHKYVVEVFALIVAGMDPSEYRDLKVPNARPLSVEELVGLARQDAAVAAVNDLGEHIEIRFPVLAFLAAVLGVVLQTLLGTAVPHAVFEIGLCVFLAVPSFLSMLRVAPSLLDDPSLRASRRSLWMLLPLLLVKAALALVVVQLSGSPFALLGALLLLLPPALLAPTLSLAWGGDYFAAVVQTVAATVVLPVVIVVVVLFGAGSGVDMTRLPVAAITFGLLLIGSFVIPLVVAQLFRRRSPVRAGQVSTNWNWLGNVSIILLAGFAGFGLTPSSLRFMDGLGKQFLFVVVALLAVRALAWLYLRFVRFPTGIDRNVRIGQGAPNVFLWLSLSVALFGAMEDGFGVAVVLCFFGFLWVDDLIVVRRQRVDLRRQVTGLRTTAEPVV